MLPNVLQGDSGGPLACRLDSSSPWQLVGVTSFGSEKCITPSVYTAVPYFADWIKETMKANE